MSVPYEQIAALWSQGKSNDEVAAALGVKPSYAAAMVSQTRKRFGFERMPYRPRKPRKGSKGGRVPKRTDYAPRQPAAYWERIAALYREGKSSTEIAAVVGHSNLNPGQLVQQARYHLGSKAVPFRLFGKRAPAKPVRAPVTMTEMGRQYLRRIGEEYIFRDIHGNEEVWVRTNDPSGLILSAQGVRRAEAPRLAFKCVMGYTEKRAEVKPSLTASLQRAIFIA